MVDDPLDILLQVKEDVTSTFRRLASESTRAARRIEETFKKAGEGVSRSQDKAAQSVARVGDASKKTGQEAQAAAEEQQKAFNKTLGSVSRVSSEIEKLVGALGKTESARGLQRVAEDLSRLQATSQRENATRTINNLVLGLERLRGELNTPLASRGLDRAIEKLREMQRSVGRDSGIASGLQFIRNASERLRESFRDAFDPNRPQRFARAMQLVAGAVRRISARALLPFREIGLLFDTFAARAIGPFAPIVRIIDQLGGIALAPLRLAGDLAIRLTTTITSLASQIASFGKIAAAALGTFLKSLTAAAVSAGKLASGLGRVATVVSGIFFGAFQLAFGVVEAITSAFSQLVEILGKVFESVSELAARFIGFAGIVGTAVVGGLFLLSKQLADVGDNLQKTAQQVGVTTQQFSALEFGAELAAVTFSELQTGLRRGARILKDAVDGLTQARRPFDQLGISLRGTNEGLIDSFDLVLQVSDAFSQMEDGARKSGLATQFFGRAGAKLIPLLNLGREGILEIANEAARFGIIISDELSRQAEIFNDNIVRIVKVFIGFGFAIGEDILPKFSKLFVDIREGLLAARNQILGFVVGVVSSIEDIANTVSRLFQAIVLRKEDLAEFRDSVLDAVGDVLLAVSGIFKVGFEKAFEFAEIATKAGMAKVIDTILKTLTDADFLSALLGVVELIGVGLAKGLFSALKATIPGGSLFQKLFGDLTGIDAFLDRNLKSAQDRINRALGATGGVRGALRKFTAAFEDLPDDLRPAIGELRKSLTGLIEASEVVALLDRVGERQDEAFDRFRKKLEENNRANRELFEREFADLQSRFSVNIDLSRQLRLDELDPAVVGRIQGALEQAAEASNTFGRANQITAATISDLRLSLEQLDRVQTFQKLQTELLELERGGQSNITNLRNSLQKLIELQNDARNRLRFDVSAADRDDVLQFLDRLAQPIDVEVGFQTTIGEELLLARLNEIGQQSAAFDDLSVAVDAFTNRLREIGQESIPQFELVTRTIDDLELQLNRLTDRRPGTLVDPGEIEALQRRIREVASFLPRIAEAAPGFAEQLPIRELTDLVETAEKFASGFNPAIRLTDEFRAALRRLADDIQSGRPFDASAIVNLQRRSEEAKERGVDQVAASVRALGEQSEASALLVRLLGQEVERLRGRARQEIPTEFVDGLVASLQQARQSGSLRDLQTVEEQFRQIREAARAVEVQQLFKQLAEGAKDGSDGFRTLFSDAQKLFELLREGAGEVAKDDFLGGLRKGFDEVSARMLDIARQGEQLAKDLGTAIERFLTDALAGGLRNIQDVLQQLLTDIQRIFAQLAAQQIAGGITNLLGSLVRNLLGGGVNINAGNSIGVGGTGPGDLVPGFPDFAEGGVFPKAAGVAPRTQIVPDAAVTTFQTVRQFIDGGVFGEGESAEGVFRKTVADSRPDFSTNLGQTFGVGGVADVSPLRKAGFQIGGIARKRMFAEFGEGDVPEAFIPMQDRQNVKVVVERAAAGIKAFAPVPSGERIPVKLVGFDQLLRRGGVGRDLSSGGPLAKPPGPRVGPRAGRFAPPPRLSSFALGGVSDRPTAIAEPPVVKVPEFRLGGVLRETFRVGGTTTERLERFREGGVSRETLRSFQDGGTIRPIRELSNPTAGLPVASGGPPERERPQPVDVSVRGGGGGEQPVTLEFKFEFNQQISALDARGVRDVLREESKALAGALKQELQTSASLRQAIKQAVGGRVRA